MKFLGYIIFLSQTICAQTTVKLDEKVYVELTSLDNITVDIRYATANNFVGTNLYGTFNKAYLHKVAAKKLEAAAKHLQLQKPGWKILVFDALRPRSVQKKLWIHVEGTPQEQYVANPKIGSVHNYGFAVDVSLVDDKGMEIDMGTPFDNFTELSQPQLEQKFLQEGKLTSQQVKNRKLLRNVMTGAGFKQLPNEWWHYDALPIQELKKKYNIVE